jgi:hypothetical protein
MTSAARRSIAFGCLLVAACSPSTPTAPPTPASSSAPSPTSSAYQQLAINAPGGLAPAPDGRILAATPGNDRTLTLYDASGQTIAQVPTTLDPPLHTRWLSDASAALLWGGAGPTSPLLIVDRNGHVTDAGLPADDAGASPDGAWIASSLSGDSTGKVDIAARDGSAHRTVAAGRDVRFLGWIGDRLAFASQSGIYLVGVHSGDRPRLVIAASHVPAPVGELRPPAGGPTTSPDGSIAIVGDSHERYYLLTTTSVQPVPADAALGSDSVYWLGQHDVLATADDGMLEVIDPVTMNVRSTTECGPVDSVDAAVPGQAAFRVDGKIEICDLTTGSADDLGSPPVSGRIYAFGDRFVLHGSGATYLITPPAP